jgi:CubicO group peptidase (beta-lactamase class C family)
MMQSVSGGGHHGGGIFINTWDQARFGLLFCRKGKWKGKQLVPESWTRLVREPSPGNPAYGLMWWTNEKNDLPGLPKTAYYANGFGGNYIVVDEEHDLVIVTRWLDTSKLGEFVRLVAGSLEPK